MDNKAFDIVHARHNHEKKSQKFSQNFFFLMADTRNEWLDLLEIFQRQNIMMLNSQARGERWSARPSEQSKTNSCMFCVSSAMSMNCSSGANSDCMYVTVVVTYSEGGKVT